MILFLKPSLAGHELENVMHYAQTHPDFPHESTADPYFGDAQWESYRRLGDDVASRIFAANAGGGEVWVPAQMQPPPVGGRGADMRTPPAAPAGLGSD